MKVQPFDIFECSVQILPNSCRFWNNSSVFLQILHQYLGSWDITPLYFFSENFIYFKEPIKVQIWRNFTWAVERLTFSTLMDSFGRNHVQFLLKSILSLMTLKSDPKFKEKLTCSFKHDLRNLVRFHPTTQKFENFTLTGSFCPKYKGLR